jgi:Tfp pilus assembly protein PilV
MTAARRGSTYIEVLVALLVTTVGVAAMFALYSFVMSQLLNSHREVQAGVIARADLEKVKVMWYSFFH